MLFLEPQGVNDAGRRFGLGRCDRHDHDRQTYAENPLSHVVPPFF